MPKEQDPAMLFYGRDFYDDIHVSLMDWAQQGMYLRLLWWCWTEGGIPADPEELRTLLKRTPDEWGQDWPRLSVCFTGAMPEHCPNDAGEILINRKVEEIRRERRAFREARAEHARAAAKKRWQPQENGSGSNPRAMPGQCEADAQRCPPSASTSASIITTSITPNLQAAFERCRELHPNCTDPDLAYQILMSLADKGDVTDADASLMEPGMRRWLESAVWSEGQERYSREWRKFSEWMAGKAWRANPAPSAEATAAKRTRRRSTEGSDPNAEWIPPWRAGEPDSEGE